LNGKPSVRYVGLKEVVSLPSSPDDIDHSYTGSKSLRTSSSADPEDLKVSALVFTTDIRSPKCAEIQRNPACSLSTWSPETGIQLRVDGLAYIYKPAWSQAANSPKTWQESDTRSSLHPSMSTAIDDIVTRVDLEVPSRALFDGLHPRTRAWHTRGAPGNAIDTYTQVEKEKWLVELQVRYNIPTSLRAGPMSFNNAYF
jgi:hypothetical protein